MAKGESYEAFVDKFKPKLTTDDCYTPQAIYDTVLEWVRKEYALPDGTPIVRPFWPGGDYEAEDYPDGCVVVDNPPFSIISKICAWYAERGIRFFLFAPGLTPFASAYANNACAVCAYAEIEYENGAVVRTAFLTNLENCIARSAPELNRMIRETVEKLRKEKARELPKYRYPAELLTASRLNQCSRYGVDLKIRREDAAFIRTLDSQRIFRKSIFGGGYLLSEKAAAEKAAAEKAAAEKAAAEKAAANVWELSERERMICAALSRKTRSGGALYYYYE